MSKGAVIAILFGGGLAAVLAANSDLSLVGQAMLKVGWGVLAVVAIRALIVCLCGYAWGILLAPLVVRHSALFLLLRWMRESINVMLPVMQVGGDLVGGRLLTFWSIPGGLAGAGILVDLLLQAIAQLLFTLLGLWLLAGLGGAEEILRPTLLGALVAGCALGGFYLSQRFGLFKLVEKALNAVAARWPSAAIGQDIRLHESLQAFYRHPGSILGSLAVHMVAWLVGAAEIYVMLFCLGLSPTWVEAVILESVGQAVRGASSPVPGSVGFQEWGFVVLGQFFGLPTETALALSLLKRVPDFALGIPGLMVWGLIERRRLGQDGEIVRFRSFGGAVRETT